MNGMMPYNEFELLWGIVKRTARRYYESRGYYLKHKKQGRVYTTNKRAMEEYAMILSCVVACMDGALGVPMDKSYCEKALRGEFVEDILGENSDALIGQIAEIRGELNSVIEEAILGRIKTERLRKEIHSRYA